MVDGIHSIIENIEGIEDVLELSLKILNLHNNSSREGNREDNRTSKKVRSSPRNDPLGGRPNSRGELGRSVPKSSKR